VNEFKNIFLTITRWIKQAWLFPSTLADAREQRRQLQVARNENESDRLDRLRNPSKYQGK
jgi:hypothetical protein